MNHLYCIWLLLQISYFSAFANQNQEKRYAEPLPAKNSISGRLFDKATGKPLDCVKVMLTNSNIIRYYLVHIEREISNAEQNKFPTEIIKQLKEEARIANNFAKQLSETSFVTKTDENGYFILALPDEVPSQFPLKLDIRFVDNKILNSTGEPDKCMINSIGNIKIDYKGGYFYEKMLLNVTRANECNGRIMELLENESFDD